VISRISLTLGDLLGQVGRKSKLRRGGTELEHFFDASIIQFDRKTGLRID
jgi:hypothetical protein